MKDKYEKICDNKMLIICSKQQIGTLLGEIMNSRSKYCESVKVQHSDFSLLLLSHMF